MDTTARMCRVAALAAACFVAQAAWAAAPVDVGTELPAPEAVSATPATIYELETEMVVHNWVLCVSEGVAKQLVRAREEGVEKALSAYDSLKQERKCGQFAELRVILQQPLYKSSPESGHDARVFGALVHLADNWASAYVVTGGLSDE